jgi:hypothetical protein
MSNEKATIEDRASILPAEQNGACDACLKEGRKDFVGYFRSLRKRNPVQYWRLVGVLMGLYAKELGGDASSDPDDEESLS